MSLLKEILNEMVAGGATGAGAIAAVPGAVGAENTKEKKKLKKVLRDRKLPVNVTEMFDDEGYIINESIKDFISSAREFIRHGNMPLYKAKRTDKADENKDGEIKDPPDLMFYFAKMITGLKRIADRKDEEEKAAVNDINFRTDQHGEDWVKKNSAPNAVKTIASRFREPSVKKALSKYLDDIEQFFLSGKQSPVAESIIAEGEEVDFNPSDVISKLKAAEKKVTNDDDTVRYGLEDEKGNIVKVWVVADQAKDFEAALGAMLNDHDTDATGDEDDVTAIEIAEVLYTLKDRFDIVDVEWPPVPEDEEEEQEVGDEDADISDDEGGDEESDLDMEADVEDTGEEGDLEGGDEESDLDMEADSTEDQATSTLQSVIDMMKADAEARKADAEARAAEANSRSDEYAAKAAAEKLKQEEELLDMEVYYKQKKEADDEAKRLAKLAKYKHDLAQDSGSSLGSDDFASEEEEETADDVISRDQLLDKIAAYLKTSQQAQG